MSETEFEAGKITETEVEQPVSNETTASAQVQVKPLSDNAFAAFFQKIGRWWLGVWYGFADKHPKASAWIYKIFFFFVFSISVTIWQALVMLFLPKAFTALSAAFAWPGVQVGSLTWNKPIFDAAGALTGGYIADSPALFAIFGDEVLGNWIAFEIAVFTAQCINFPLQRNITFKSHGNPWYQAMWYFIGWVGISFFTGAVWGIIDPLLKSWGWFYKVEVVDGVKVISENGILNLLATLLKTFITGGISMIVFFPIFLIIFPDRAKQAKSAQAKLEKLKANNAPAEKIKLAEEKALEYSEIAAVEKARKEAQVADSYANAKAVAWDSSKKKLEKLKAKGAAQTELDAQQAIIEKNYNVAVDTAGKRDTTKAEYDKVLAEVNGARAERGAAAIA